jgi:thiol:disulfide interchange protein
MRTFALVTSLLSFLVSGTACRVASTATSRTIPIQELGSSVDDCLSRNRGKPVLIAFIAQWSPTAKLPRRALETDEARAAIRQHRVVPVVADVTDRKDLLSTVDDFARVGVPCIFLYTSDRSRKFHVPADSMADGAAIAQFIREHL